MTAPRVTVLLAVHNGEPYLEEALGSILDQTYRDFELLVVDDASDDGTAALLAGIDDERLRVIRNERNLGQVPSLNLGLQEARGEYVARLDHDDVCLPERLERQVGVLDAEPSVGLVGCWADVIDAEGHVLGSMRATIPDRAHFVFESLRGNVLILHPAAVYRRALAVAVGGYDPSLAPSEDKDLWRKFLIAGCDARIVERTLLRYRSHASQLSQVQSEVQGANDARSHEALLAYLAPAANALALRLLLRDEPEAWLAPPSPTDFVSLVDGSVALLGLSRAQAVKLDALLRMHVLRVALGGWRTGGKAWRRHSSALVGWAATDGHRSLVRHRALRAGSPVLMPIRRLHIACARRLRRLAPATITRSRRLRALYSRSIGNG